MESANLIKELNLNVLPEKIFINYNKKEIEDFIKNFPAEFYAVRDKSVAMSKKHKLAVPRYDFISFMY